MQGRSNCYQIRGAVARPPYTSPTGDMFPFGAFLISSQFLIAVAGGVPKIDVTKTCRNSATVTSATQNDIDACITDEWGAHDQLIKEWAQFSSSVKARCVQASTAYLPSYI